MDREALDRYVERGRQTMAAGFVTWGKRATLSAVAVGWAVAMAGLAEAARPPERLSLPDWAEKHRVISPDSGSPMPGPWRNSVTPYLVEPMKALGADDPCDGVVLKFSAQVGKTEVGINWTGYIADVERLPMLITMQGLDEINKFNRSKLSPSIAASPRMAATISPEGDGPGAKSTAKYKHWPGGGCNLVSANSSAGLQGISRARYWGDEVSEYPAEAGKRGDPVLQAFKRMEAWTGLSKFLLTSTCGLKDACRISKAYADSDQRRLYVPCPHCGDYQVLELANLQWDDSVSPRRPVYSCAACGVDIEERFKRRMVAGGIWVPCFVSKDPAANPTPPNVIEADGIADWQSRDCEGRRVKGYHLWKIYSGLGDWTSILYEYADAEGDSEALKVFWQQTLAEAYDDGGEAPDFEGLAARVESYPREIVPSGGLLLTGAVDVQGDRLEWGTYAWGARLQGWLVDKGIIEGKTDTPEPWARLRELMLSRSYEFPSGERLPVDRWGVDTGYRSPYVYAATKGLPNVLNLDGRGADKPDAQPLGSPKTIRSKLGKVSIGAVRKYDVGTYSLKSRAYGMLRQWEAGPDTDGNWPRGVIHFNDLADREFFEQVTAEQLVPHQLRGGRVRYYWQKIKGRPNEHHDILIYNMALAFSLGWERNSADDWAALHAERGGSGDADPRTLEDLWGVSAAETAHADKSEKQLMDRFAAIAALNSGD